MEYFKFYFYPEDKEYKYVARVTAETNLERKIRKKIGEGIYNFYKVISERNNTFEIKFEDISIQRKEDKETGDVTFTVVATPLVSMKRIINGEEKTLVDQEPLTFKKEVPLDYFEIKRVDLKFEDDICWTVVLK